MRLGAQERMGASEAGGAEVACERGSGREGWGRLKQNGNRRPGEARPCAGCPRLGRPKQGHLRRACGHPQAPCRFAKTHILSPDG